MNNIPNFYIYFLISEMDTNAVAISQLVLGSWSFNRKWWMGVGEGSSGIVQSNRPWVQS